MKSKKITAAVFGLVLTLGLVVTGCGSNGGSGDSAKADSGVKKKQMQTDIR